MKCTRLTARDILDSRGAPTLEVELCSGDLVATASVPSGKSTGRKEATEKRDEDGGMKSAMREIHDTVAPLLLGNDLASPDAIDALLLKLDGTRDKSKLGGNVMLAVSIAATRLFALEANLPLWRYIAEQNNFAPKLPRLYVNMLEGGVHADFRTPFQEYLVVPDSMSPREAYELATDIFKDLANTLKGEYSSVPSGDEGGLSPKIPDIEKPLVFLQEATGDRDAALALDVAASELYQDDAYVLAGERYTQDELLARYIKLVRDFGILSLEDPFDENDVTGFQRITDELGGQALIVGDDLSVTNPRILEAMIRQQTANALIIKPNQVGTLREVYETVGLAHQAGWRCIASHRSGETTDTFIADLAVAIGAFGIKAGAPTQPERCVKYARLMEIEKEMI